MRAIAYEITHAPAYASLRLNLKANETVLAESGSMVAMDPWISLRSRVRGGLLKGVGRLFAGESLFISEFTAEGRPGTLQLSPSLPGDIHHYTLEGNGLIIQSSGFLAASPTVELDTQFQGLKGFFSGESLFLLRASGYGDLWFSSFGAILPVEVQGNYVVDTGYIVAFEETLSYQVEVFQGLAFRNLMTAILGGEGLVCRFQGQGRVWIQSRKIHQLLNFLHGFRPTKSDG